jgi:RNA methyltransferase, TrmH family
LGVVFGMRNKLTNELAVYGYNAVKALADIHPERINRLFLREELLTDFTVACKSLAARKRPYKFCDDEELERVCKSPRHQGLVAMMYEPEIPLLEQDELARWVEAGLRFLILDSVGNDNNLGAIVRSAAFFGITHIVLSATDEAAGITSAAYRVAEGGMEHVEFWQVNDIGRFVAAIAEDVLVIGADHRSRTRLSELPAAVRDLKTSRFGAVSTRYGLGAHLPVALVMGNEERGLSSMTKKACAVLARIPGVGNVESLNVAQAATLFLHTLFEMDSK